MAFWHRLLSSSTTKYPSTIYNLNQGLCGCVLYWRLFPSTTANKEGGKRDVLQASPIPAEMDAGVSDVLALNYEPLVHARCMSHFGRRHSLSRPELGFKMGYLITIFIPVLLLFCLCFTLASHCTQPPPFPLCRGKGINKAP
jgi:hypothetical protein